MAINLAPLPFGYNELEPFLSKESLRFHHKQYQHACTERLNESIRGTRFAKMSLTEIVCQSDGTIFKNAAMVWNHNFYWQCLTPTNHSLPHGLLLEAIDQSFGSFELFKTKFKQIAANNFGSGWTWLIRTTSGELQILNTANAQTPLVDLNSTVLLALDDWEHAYYLDYQNDFSEYVDNFWDFVNWSFVDRNFKQLFLLDYGATS